jgi:hypothetical protein
LGAPSCSTLGEGLRCRRRNWVCAADGLPAVVEDCMSRRSGSESTEPLAGRRVRSRTAKAARISRHAAKSRCAGEWGGWGRLSEDGLGQHNPVSSEDPWGGGLPNLHGGASIRNRPRHSAGTPSIWRGARRTKANQRVVSVRRARLELADPLGRLRPKHQPSSRTGENPPYGMIGGNEETSASFEVRTAPRSHPTRGVAVRRYPLCRFS